MLLGDLVALWPIHNTTSHVRVRSFRPHQRPPRPWRSRASTPPPVALRSSRSDLRALAHQENSDLLHPISFKVGSLSAEDRHVAHVACPLHYRLHEPLRLGPKAPRNLYTEWDECRPLRKISMCAHRAVPPSPLLLLAVAGNFAGVYEPTAMPLSLWSFHAMRVSMMYLVVPVGS
jgi:hypothetical protein